ncbi:hypothetical protein FKM82_004189 [Ascaphus truei]|uniref:protein NCBP2AS2 n=1 Tax=Ascaphus truei TaxID=8439 RepID=UPI003F59B6CC
MVLRRLLFRLLNNPQLIEKLSESRLMRRAAQITVFAVTKVQLTGKDAAQRLLRSDTVRQQAAADRAPRDMQEVTRTVRRVRDTFVKELRTGLQEAKRRRGGGK